MDPSKVEVGGAYILGNNERVVQIRNQRTPNTFNAADVVSDEWYVVIAEDLWYLDQRPERRLMNFPEPQRTTIAEALERLGI